MEESKSTETNQEKIKEALNIPVSALMGKVAEDTENSPDGHVLFEVTAEMQNGVIVTLNVTGKISA